MLVGDGSGRKRKKDYILPKKLPVEKNNEPSFTYRTTPFKALTIFDWKFLQLSTTSIPDVFPLRAK